MADKGKGLAYKCFPPPYEEVERVYEDVSFPESHPGDHSLPYVVVNMVASLDGKVSSSDGKSGSIGGGVDRGAMRMLRSKVDAVAIGAGTVRAEKVSLTSEGMRTPEPKAVIISASLDFPPENLASLAGQETIILTVEDGAGEQKPGEIPGPAQMLPAKTLPARANPDGRIDLRTALKTLKEEHGVDRLLLEGGPGLNAGMLSIGVVSEIFATIAPKLLGGDPPESPGILSGSLPNAPRDLSLSSIHASTPDGEVLLRYKVL